jgi:hypothetical protein
MGVAAGTFVLARSGSISEGNRGGKHLCTRTYIHAYEGDYSAVNSFLPLNQCEHLGVTSSQTHHYALRRDGVIQSRKASHVGFGPVIAGCC